MKNNTHKLFAIIAGLLGALSIMQGALGAHLLETKLSPSSLDTWELGVTYQMYHALFLIGISHFLRNQYSPHLKWSGYSAIGGVLLFSGSLYCLAFKHIFAPSTLKIIGPLTPIGGLLFIAAWFLFAISFLRVDNDG